MKLFGQILMTLGLAFGALAASTVYHVKVEDLGEYLKAGLTLNEDIKPKSEEGQEEKDKEKDKKKNKKEEKEEPLAKKGEKITPALVKQLKAHQVYAVRVKEFSFLRWDWNWVFVISVLGLIGGALLVKRSAKETPGDATEESQLAESPAYALQETAKGIDDLLGKLEETSDREERLKMIVGGVDELQNTHLAAYVDARDKLTAQYGLGGMAELMDEFSTAERSINRAWSAASDGHLDEALTSLEAARPLLQRPLARLQAK